MPALNEADHKLLDDIITKLVREALEPYRAQIEAAHSAQQSADRAGAIEAIRDARRVVGGNPMTLSNYRAQHPAPARYIRSWREIANDIETLNARALLAFDKSVLPQLERETYSRRAK